MKLDKQKLLLAMANACITVSGLSEQSDLSRPAITNYITGKGNPKPATIGKIAKALNVKVEDLIEGSE